MKKPKSQLNEKIQALNVAKMIGCSGAHRTADGVWMPCESHEILNEISTVAESSRWRTVVPGSRPERIQKKSLDEWFKEKWVDISRPKKGGGFEPCGRGDAKKGAYPKCVPASKAASMTAAEIASAVRRKRKAESTQKRRGKKPIYVPTEKKNLDALGLNEKAAIPTNPELYARVKAKAKRKFDVYPSAYANAWLVREYKRRGGGYRSDETSQKSSQEDARRFTRMKKGRKYKKRRNLPMHTGVIHLDGVGLVSDSGISMKSEIKSLNRGPEYVRETDPDVFLDPESARFRSRQLGCIGISRRISKNGRAVWMPCTNMTDYSRLSGTTSLGRRHQRENSQSMVRTILRQELSKLKRKKSICEEILQK
jgi:hypothetical protein